MVPYNAEVRRVRRGVLRRNQFVGVIVALNGEEVWRTSESYNNRADVVAAFALIGIDQVDVLP